VRVRVCVRVCVCVSACVCEREKENNKILNGIGTLRFSADAENKEENKTAQSISQLEVNGRFSDKKKSTFNAI
jgi:hypothetical protein